MERKKRSPWAALLHNPCAPIQSAKDLDGRFANLMPAYLAIPRSVSASLTGAHSRLPQDENLLQRLEHLNMHNPSNAALFDPCDAISL